jgi:pimeloyl-ACP methyl ester carboxylesterase
VIFAFLWLVAATLSPPPSLLHVGSLTLHRCAGVPAYCGTIARPLDPAGDVSGTIPIGFTLLPHREANVAPAGTILAMEGGPGYPSGASFAAYAKAFGPLLQRWDMLPSIARIGQLLSRLRRPGSPVTPSQLAFVMASAGLDTVAYEDLDAAARAYLAGDRIPLQKLVAEAYRYEEQNGSDAKAFSAALFVASTCSDDPEPYDMTLPPAAREAEWRRVLAARERSDPQMDAPFTISEFLGMPPDYGYVDLCAQWPVASSEHPSREPLVPDRHLPDVPVLVLVGDLDTITTPAESAAAAKLFQRSTYVVVRNTGHVTAIGDVYDCASRIVRRFIVTLQAGNTSCTNTIPALPTVAAYELRTTPHFTVRDAALAAARDVLSRVRSYGMHHGTGLRGGTFSVRTSGGRTTILLDGVKWTQDVPIWGTVHFDQASGAVQLRAQLSSGRVVIASWNAYRPAISAIR